MDSIRNYKLKQLLKKDLETIQIYLTALMHLEPIATENEIFDMTLGQVQDIKEHLIEGTLDNLIHAVCLADGKEYKEALRMRVLDFFGKVNSVTAQVKEINHAEEVSLQSNQPNFKWEAVGGAEKMSKFGIYITLDRLAGGDITKYKQILETSYADVFTKLYMDTVKGDLEYEMSQIKTQK